jgi:hypothetical protein
MIVVPGLAERVRPVHQDVEAAALGAVEVLHAERRAVACPVVELRAGEGECGRREDLGYQPFDTQAIDEACGGVRRRLVDNDWPSNPFERFPVGVGAEILRAVAQLDGEVAHAGKNQVQLLPVETPAAQHPCRLDEHNLSMPMLCGAVDVRAELVAEDPQRRVGHLTSLVFAVGSRAASRATLWI